MAISKLRLIIIVFGAILAVVLSRNIFTLVSVEDRIADLKSRITNEEEKQKELTRLKLEATSAAFIEREARERLGLAKEGETVIVLPPPDFLRSLVPPLDDGEHPPHEPNWKKWLKIFF